MFTHHYAAFIDYLIAGRGAIPGGITLLTQIDVFRSGEPELQLIDRRRVLYVLESQFIEILLGIFERLLIAAGAGCLG